VPLQFWTRPASHPPGFRAGDRVGEAHTSPKPPEAGDRCGIEYKDRHGTVTAPNVRVLKVLRFGSRRREQYIKAFCELKGEERTFRLDRIISIKPLH